MIDPEDLYSDYKVLKHADVVDAYLSNSVFIPLKHVQLFLTNKCNCNCVFCGNRGGNDNPSVFDPTLSLSKEALESLITDFKFLGVKAVSLSGGGDFTLHPDADWFIGELEDAHIYYGLVTNGILLDKYIHSFDDYLSWVRFSINGTTPDIYAQVHKTSPNNFKKVMNNLVLTAKKKPEGAILGVNYLFTGDNHYYTDNFVKQCKDSGAYYIRFSLPAGYKHDILAKNMVNELDDLVDDLKSDHADNNFHVFNHVGYRSKAVEKDVQDYPLCFVKDVATMIGADGLMYVCCSKLVVGKGAYGDIRRGFAQEWLRAQQHFREFDASVSCQHKCLYYNKNKVMNSILKNPICSHDYFI